MDDAGEGVTGEAEGEERRDPGEEQAEAGVGVDESVKVQPKRFGIIKPLTFFYSVTECSILINFLGLQNIIKNGCIYFDHLHLENVLKIKLLVQPYQRSVLCCGDNVLHSLFWVQAATSLLACMGFNTGSKSPSVMYCKPSAVTAPSAFKVSSTDLRT